MTTSRIHAHHSLPAPVVHAGFSVSQSKSHVLAGVQDAYWSDDEAEDAECPLCLEEMDISDLNFKPCICGYQICRFCWHHIKENLNGRCPACRRVYTDEAVEFKPIAKEDHKRLTQQKKQRERERKELDALGRRQLANVRVVQRNVVYVIGIGPRFAKEELIPTLRSNEYFGQYGKITKILLVKRTPSGGGAPVVGLYITYNRREDAARAIAAVDGTASPGGGRDVMRASYGTTKYCMSFLRGVSCGDHGCMNLHEWGDEKDCFTKEDLTTLKHTIKATESRSRNVAASKKAEESDGLPRAAAWAHKGSNPPTPTVLPTNTGPTNHIPSAPSASRQPRRGGLRQSRISPATVPANPIVSESRPSSARSHQDRKLPGTTKTPSQASSSRPPTPAPAGLPQRPATPADVKALRQKKESKLPQPSRSPAPSTAADSDQGSGSQDATPASPAVRPKSTDSVQSSVPSVPPGIPTIPPGLSAPPGIPIPTRPPRVETASPQTPLLASQSSYQMSTAARALLDDVKARRESVIVAAASSPFPDFDRMLLTLSGGDGEFGGFSFNLDPKLAGDDADNVEPLPDFEAEANIPFHGTYMDAFPALRSTGPPAAAAFPPPPGLPYPHNPNRSIYDPLAVRSSPVPLLEKQPTGSSSYTGSFNPFADANEDPVSATASPTRRSQYSPLDDDSSRKVSRFGFARGRQGSTAASSPLHVSSPLSNSDNQSFYNSTDPPQIPAQPQWSTQGRQEYGLPQPGSAMGSPLAQHAQTVYSQQHSRFQPFDSGVSEAQLRDLIQSSRDRANSTGIRNSPAEQAVQFKFAPTQQPFNDPAIMSARFASPVPDTGYTPSHVDHISHSHISYGPPPGLSYPQGPLQSPTVSSSYGHGGTTNLESNGSRHVSTTTSPVLSLALSSSDFPALMASTVDPSPTTRREEQSHVEDIAPLPDIKALEKAERKAAKKAAATEKAAERQRVAQEKAAVKAVEKARIAQEKAVEREKEREKAAALKAQQEKAQKERAEKEKAAKEKEREEVVKADKERVAQAEKEKAAQVKKGAMSKQVDLQKAGKRNETATSALKDPARQPTTSRPPATPAAVEPVSQVPLLSKRPKKNKPATKPIKVPKEEETVPEEPSAIPSASTSEVPYIPLNKANTADSSSTNSRSQSADRNLPSQPTSIKELLEEIDILNPAMDLPNHPFFDTHKINPAAKMPLEYGPLVHALSALSVGGGSFANNMPSGSIDNAVSSFQQLLETLTQTISDLLRLLPRTTWDDSSSFDGVLRDMLKGDDFLDDGGDDGPGKEDEVAALTLALERRARWMEVQLSKLEELHRDINTAAVRAVLSFNDNGWDRHGFMPRIGNTLRRFDNIGMIEDEGVVRAMNADELEKKLLVAKEAAVFAETEVREVMERMQAIKPEEAET